MSARAFPLMILLSALLLPVGCADKPDSYAPLTALQSHAAELRRSALPNLAPSAFAEAELALARAERSLGEVEADELRHLTALADLRLRTAQAEGDAAAARSEQARLVEARRRILAEARQRQLERERRGFPVDETGQQAFGDGRSGAARSPTPAPALPALSPEATGQR